MPSPTVGTALPGRYADTLRSPSTQKSPREVVAAADAGDSYPRAGTHGCRRRHRRAEHEADLLVGVVVSCMLYEICSGLPSIGSTTPSP